MLNVVNAECRNKVHYAECLCAKCHYAECHYAECHNAECHYAECHYAECLSTPKSDRKMVVKYFLIPP